MPIVFAPSGWRRALFCLCLALCGALPTAQAEPATARRGRIDLSALDVAHGETAALDGDWAFYWQQLLTPEDFGAGREEPEAGYLAMPSVWSKATFRGQPLPATGYATYRLTLVPPPGRHELALHVGGIESAYRLWIDGRLAGEIGVVGRDAASEKGEYLPQIVRLASNGEPLELLLQVSNFHSWEGAVPIIKFGSAKTIESDQAKRLSISMVLAGGMLMMCLYHLALFFMRRREPTFLYFSLYCLIRIGYTVFSGASESMVRQAFPAISVVTAHSLSAASLYLSPAVSLAFFCSLYPHEFSRRVLFASLAVSGGLLLIGALTRFTLLPGVQLFFYGYSLLLIAYYIYCLCRAWRAKRVGSGLILVGYLFLAAALANDMLMDVKAIRTTWLIPQGMFIFVLFQSFALARRFTIAFASVEHLSAKLEAQNDVLHKEMDERIRLEHEIELVGEKERRAISRELHDGLCQQLTAARLHCSVLRLEREGSGEATSAIGKMAALLHGAVDHAYALSRGLWPVEYDQRDLLTSLEELAGKMRAAHGLDISLRCELSCARCHSAQSSPVFHIAKEALQNIGKHADASCVQIVLECRSPANTLLLRIDDDGVGRQIASAPAGGLGLRIMAHRARSIDAQLSVADRCGGGTTVSLSVPCAMPTCPATR